MEEIEDIVDELTKLLIKEYIKEQNGDIEYLKFKKSELIRFMVKFTKLIKKD